MRSLGNSNEEGVFLALPALLPHLLFDLYELWYVLATVREVTLQELDGLARVRSLSPEQMVELPMLLARVRALRQQVQAQGPLLLRSWCQNLPGEGACGLCGVSLQREDRFRCASCTVAMGLVLGSVSLSAWIISAQMPSVPNSGACVRQPEMVPESSGLWDDHEDSHMQCMSGETDKKEVG